MRGQNWFYTIPLRLRSLFRREQVERELDEELRFHIEQRAAAEAADGKPPDEARYVALRKFEGLEQQKEDCRSMRGVSWFENAVQDLRYALRMLRRSPGISAAAILSLALGIGANTAIFSLLNAVVMRPLPVPQPEQLVQLTYTYPAQGAGANNWNSYFGYPHFEHFRDQSKTLASIFCGTRAGRVSVAAGGASGIALADAYTSSFFAVLGLSPQRGRFFAPEEDRADASVAVLSDGYWRRRFGADPSIVGATVNINRIPFTVIGVTPSGFSGIQVGSPPDLWVPLRALDRIGQRDDERWIAPFNSWLTLGARLRPEVSTAQAQTELDGIHRRLVADQVAASEFSRNSENMQRFARESRLVLRAAANGVHSGLRETYALPLRVLMWVAGLVLLVACANVANLLLARASSRRREIAIRLALGAGRARVIRQLLTESTLLGCIGGAVSLFIAWWVSTALMGMIAPVDSARPLDVGPDWRVFGFTATASLLTGILFGLAPALRGTRIDTAPVLKDGARDTGRSSRVLDRALVVAQIALSVVLITGAGLFVRTLQKMWSVDLGYDRENVLMFSIDARLEGYPASRLSGIYREILDKMRALPDVRSASVSVVRPVDDQYYLVDVVNELDGRRVPERETIRVAWNLISPGYFSTVSTPIVAGRDFHERDTETSPQVVIINESLARSAFPNQNPLGRRIALSTVVGVVKDSHYNGVRDRPRPVLYHSLFQQKAAQTYRWGFVSYELRYQQQAALLDQVRREVASVDKNLAVFRVSTLRAQAERSLLRERLLAMMSSSFGLLALLLACVGLSGLMAYAVARRTGEIGLRLALGARRAQILWLVLRETLLLAAAGVAIGVPSAIVAARYARTLFYEISPADPLTIVVTILILVGVTGVAGSIPASRALRVDPVVALRHD